MLPVHGTQNELAHYRNSCPVYLHSNKFTFLLESLKQMAGSAGFEPATNPRYKRNSLDPQVKSLVRYLSAPRARVKHDTIRQAAYDMPF